MQKSCSIVILIVDTSLTWDDLRMSRVRSSHAVHSIGNHGKQSLWGLRKYPIHESYWQLPPIPNIQVYFSLIHWTPVVVSGCISGVMSLILRKSKRRTRNLFMYLLSWESVFGFFDILKAQIPLQHLQPRVFLNLTENLTVSSEALLLKMSLVLLLKTSFVNSLKPIS